MKKSKGLKEGKKDIVMVIAKEKKKEVIQKFKTNEKDTGSPRVQVAVLTERINALGDHFKTHVKDHHSRRGLLKLVSQRRKLLTYLKRENQEAYYKLIEDLDLRK